MDFRYRGITNHLPRAFLVKDLGSQMGLQQHQKLRCLPRRVVKAARESLK